MRKIFYAFAFVFFCITAISAKTITSDVAQTVAANFLKQNSAQVKALTLAYTATSSTGEAAYFVFNSTAGNGFVIVTADDALYPIIGYSTEGSYVVPAAGTSAGIWMEGRKNEIISCKAENVTATAEITNEWTTYLSGKVISNRVTGSVAPLVKTMWDQPSPYNALCPGGSVTGCVATTMAQIMRYWKYPIKGTGSSSYNSSYGVLSANYGNTTYNWNNMPTGSVTSANSDVATLMFQCGVSVNMQYSPSGSGAYVTTYDASVCAQVSYSKYFGYDAGSIKGLQRFNYSDANWISLIENDLNSSRPVQYVGYDPSYGGHTWVCDGYDVNNNFHMNWGWSGYDNGYFTINAMSPGGTYNFSNGHEVLVGIMPKAASPNDAGILAVTSPTGTTCNLSITPVVRLQNFGNSSLTSCTISYYIDANTPSTYNWTGTLAVGAYVNVTLPAIPVSAGTHSFTSYTTKPNNVTDGNVANDKSTSSFTIASPSVLPVSEKFDATSFLPTGWSLWNPDGDASWQIVTTVAHSGKNCIGFNNCDGNGSGDMTGTKDKFITMPYNFTGQPNSNLSFDVAYAPCTYNGSLYADSLVVYYSVNCGSTWTQVYKKGGIALATAPTFDAGATYGCWSPTTTQWRTDVVNLSSLAGQQSVMFAFENRSRWGEWIYLDNISVTGSVTGLASIPEAQPLHIYPNPANDMFTVEGSATGDKIHYSLFSIIGEELRAGTVPTNGNRFNYTMPVQDIAKGMYLLRIADNEHSWTEKVEIR